MTAVVLQYIGMGFGLGVGVGLVGLFIRWVRDSFRLAMSY